MKMLHLALPVLMMIAAPAFAQQSAPPPGNWDQLDATQRELLLQPVRDRWNLADTEQRQRMLDHATRWRDMPAEERANARVGMKRFHRLSPEQQAQMRVLYNKTRDMKPQERREAFALFHAMRDMNAEQRQDLRNRWAKMSPEQRETWMREHAPRRHGHKGPQPKQ
ncbi:DUF3106 domain-containing protein [Solilutibacter tolerans]|uniref:DUF3106 domain-containing protein n=1 Tax=Solilutibacter tolerans TaxID=1604334 RepID=A0A1N6TQC3_9GAMM|nr:DUF3106 domain-containing protein [Lysobacter tolerans]SIQ55568.1 Protein of unknown function [Lysobacter tolerans]